MAVLGVSWASLGLSWLVLVSLGPLLASTDLFWPLLDLSWPLQASPGSFLEPALSLSWPLLVQIVSERPRTAQKASDEPKSAKSTEFVDFGPRGSERRKLANKICTESSEFVDFLGPEA